MTTPTNHHITVTLPNGKHVRGKVVYLQPKAERWRPQTPEVDIVCGAWLAPYRFEAIYTTPTQEVRGFYTVHAYMGEGMWLRLFGTFERAHNETAQVP